MPYAMKINEASEMVREEVTALKENDDSVKKVLDNGRASSGEVGDLLIGDSIIRDVKPDSPDLEVVPMNGKSYMDIRKRIHESGKFRNLYIVAGSNNCKSSSPIVNIIEQGKQLEQTAKEHAENVVLSSILPRDDEEGVDEKVKLVNAGMKQIAAEEGVQL